MPGAFLDSNVLVYAFTTDPRAAVAEALLQQRPVISVQGLNEFANVARRKLGMNWKQLGRAVEALRTLCPCSLPISTRMSKLFELRTTVIRSTTLWFWHRPSRPAATPCGRKTCTTAR